MLWLFWAGLGKKYVDCYIVIVFGLHCHRGSQGPLHRGRLLGGDIPHGQSIKGSARTRRFNAHQVALGFRVEL